jgi:hypothetical protein
MASSINQFKCPAQNSSMPIIEGEQLPGLPVPREIAFKILFDNYDRSLSSIPCVCKEWNKAWNVELEKYLDREISKSLPPLKKQDSFLFSPFAAVSENGRLSIRSKHILLKGMIEKMDLTQINNLSAIIILQVQVNLQDIMVDPDPVQYLIPNMFSYMTTDQLKHIFTRVQNVYRNTITYRPALCVRIYNAVRNYFFPPNQAIPVENLDSTETVSAEKITKKQPLFTIAIKKTLFYTTHSCPIQSISGLDEEVFARVKAALSRPPELAVDTFSYEISFDQEAINEQIISPWQQKLIKEIVERRNQEYLSNNPEISQTNNLDFLPGIAL